MIIENKGIRTNTFYLPPFDLNEGETVILNLFNRGNSYEMSMFLKDIFCGNKINQNVHVYKKLKFVEYIFETELRRLFYPITVGEYLKKNANPNSPFAEKIYEIEWINKKTKVNTLAGNPRKLLSLYATLSKTNNIVFDLAGQDPYGARKTYKMVKDSIKHGGSAILLDAFGDMKDDCTKYIEIEWILS